MTIDNTEIVRLAILAAGNIDQHWQVRVAEAVPRIAALFGEPRDEQDPNALVNVARKVSEAHVFTAEYRGHEVDTEGRDGGQPTLRAFVKLFDEKNQDSKFLDDQGCQTVRTEPMWSATGRAMRRILDGLESGQKIVCYRYSEQINKTEKTSLLVHVEPLARRRDSQGTPAGPPAEQRRQGGRTPQSVPPAGGGAPSAPPPAVPPSDDNAALVELGIQFEALSPRQRVAYGRLCKETGISDPMCPSTEQMAQAYGYLAQVRS